MEVIFEEIMDLHKTGQYDLMYQKVQQLGGRTSKAIRIFGIEDNQGNIVSSLLLIYEADTHLHFNVQHPSFYNSH